MILGISEGKVFQCLRCWQDCSPFIWFSELQHLICQVRHKLCSVKWRQDQRENLLYKLDLAYKEKTPLLQQMYDESNNHGWNFSIEEIATHLKVFAVPTKIISPYDWESGLASREALTCREDLFLALLFFKILTTRATCRINKKS